MNAWTLSPVPGAVVHAGAVPVFVDCDPETLAIDLEDLAVKAHESQARVLLVSYMRGHVPDLDALVETAAQFNLEVVEDCAHALGGMWRKSGADKHKHIGTFGAIGVWSCQTNKAINAGEGGLIATSRRDLANFITIATGSYGNFAMNGASGCQTHLTEIYPTVPNYSMRMSNLTAAVAKPQIAELSKKSELWARHAAILRRALDACAHTRCRRMCPNGPEVVAWSSIQFELVEFSAVMVEEVVSRLTKQGVPLAWFGGPWKGFTSTVKDWQFAYPRGVNMQRGHERFTRTLMDLPLYHTTTWSDEVFECLATLLVDTISAVADDWAPAEAPRRVQVHQFA